ncbi:bifunctional aminoglycoside phosphotransferase/ATP-binding protein [Alkalimarinus alittae]|uniref:AAA family ATPase n=1 Tax=Alkalimarinus alittae TaxID=2961619 RepID=A0ABY6N1F8_9ALTE|nr:bifunctional aminoglycoside phosphotransferase/ATP-binding protein [Alkalimarinus alittae]UZE95865.1 AAA family ATPase [Alkalimarinus alittae]
MSVELIKALQDPTLYDHPTEGFRILETHISWVILTGSYAYKIKKPVNFGFLDFSSLEKRQYFCNEELRLNRRLAPDLYIDVIPIFGSITQPIVAVDHSKKSDNTAQDLNTSQPIEYAVRMVQFDQNGLLDVLEEAQKLTPEHIAILAKRLAAFHQNVNTHIPNSDFGTAASVFAPAVENFEQIKATLTEPPLITELLPLQEWTATTFQNLKPLISQRRALGFIRECHGDLHLGNITLFNHHVVIFDCIEFNASLSWIDTINDLAFLVMDLEKRGQWAYANQLTNHYLELTGDYQGAALLTFYKAYRAMVRAKVAILSLQADNDEKSTQVNHSLMRHYRQYIALASSYDTAPRCYILLMHGYSGSGKSYVSNHLVEQLGAIRVRTDVERKRLFNYSATENTQSPIDGGIYTHEATQKTYLHIASLASTLLGSGHAVIIDAAHLKQWQRHLLVSVAESQAVPHMIVTCCADHKVLKDRITKRAQRPSNSQKKDASEAKIDTLEKQLLSADPLSKDELKYTVNVHTDQTDALNLAINTIKSYLGS